MDMAPYSKKVHVIYDGKNLVPEEPLGLPVGHRLEITVSTETIVDPRPLEERLNAFKQFKPMNTGTVLPDDAFRRDENMYPDRV